jgi:asparagine synthetase B (glutamine-hydrolysing)
MCAICAVFGGDEDDSAKFMTGFMKLKHRGPDAFRIESTSIAEVIDNLLS